MICMFSFLKIVGHSGKWPLSPHDNVAHLGLDNSQSLGSLKVQVLAFINGQNFHLVNSEFGWIPELVFLSFFEDYRDGGGTVMPDSPDTKPFIPVSAIASSALSGMPPISARPLSTGSSLSGKHSPATQYHHCMYSKPIFIHYLHTVTSCIFNKDSFSIGPKPQKLLPSPKLEQDNNADIIFQNILEN